jgi:hypothetical protein
MDGYYTTLGIMAEVKIGEMCVSPKEEKSKSNFMTGWNLYVKSHGQALSASLGAEWRSLGKNGQMEWNERAKSM